MTMHVHKHRTDALDVNEVAIEFSAAIEKRRLVFDKL